MRADMSDALDRIVPEDKRGGMYRHDAEGADDMPVRTQQMIKRTDRDHLMGRITGNGEANGRSGTCQERIGRCERNDSDYERATRYRNLARYLVS